MQPVRRPHEHSSIDRGRRAVRAGTPARAVLARAGHGRRRRSLSRRGSHRAGRGRAPGPGASGRAHARYEWLRRTAEAEGAEAAGGIHQCLRSVRAGGVRSGRRGLSAEAFRP